MSFSIDRQAICKTQDSLFSTGSKALVITTPLVILSYKVITKSIEQAKDKRKPAQIKITNLCLGTSLGIIILIPFVVSVAVMVFAKSHRSLQCYERPKISY